MIIPYRDNQPIEYTLDEAWINDIALYYSKGFPLQRLSEIFTIPPEVIKKWIDEAMSGNPQYITLKQALLKATLENEAVLIEALQDAAMGKNIIKTKKTILDGSGQVVRQEITEQTTKPDIEAIQSLLNLRSSHYNTKKAKETNITNNNNVQVVLIDNNRPINIIDKGNR